VKDAARAAQRRHLVLTLAILARINAGA